MRHSSRFFALAAAVVALLPGCQSHQSKVDALQKEYDRLGAQFQKDCAEEYLKVPPTLSEKCTEEKKTQEDAWKRLQDERAKQ
jgi:hypothetical protein